MTVSFFIRLMIIFSTVILDALIIGYHWTEIEVLYYNITNNWRLDHFRRHRPSHNSNDNETTNQAGYRIARVFVLSNSNNIDSRLAYIGRRCFTRTTSKHSVECSIDDTHVLSTLFAVSIHGATVGVDSRRGYEVCWPTHSGHLITHSGYLITLSGHTSDT